MKKLFLFAILYLMCQTTEAQTYIVSGKISDEKHQGLPFSSVLVKGTTNGTNANVDGEYTIKLQTGEYDLVYQYVGYKKKIEHISISQNITKNISLAPESYELKEVVIKDGEDPAYAVIRQAIKKRKY